MGLLTWRFTWLAQTCSVCAGHGSLCTSVGASQEHCKTGL